MRKRGEREEEVGKHLDHLLFTAIQEYKNGISPLVL